MLPMRLRNLCWCVHAKGVVAGLAMALTVSATAATSQSELLAASTRPAKSAAAKKARPAPPAPEKVASDITALTLQDLTPKSAQDLEVLVADARRVLKFNPRAETARQNLGWISVEAANRILEQETMATPEARFYALLVRDQLADTFWRIGQSVKSEPARAQAALGLYFSEGILVQKDAERGCQHFVQAGGLGHAAAAYRAYQCRQKPDPGQAKQLLEKAALGGHLVAQEVMGRACIEGGAVDVACAKKWLEPAAERGRVSAMSVLAWLYAQEPAEESLSRAVQLYEKAAAAGDPAAQSNYGELYETGRGVPRDLPQARRWYRLSADQGFGPGQFNLARMLGFGTGGEKDIAASRQLALKAREHGIAQADELLKMLEQDGKVP
ncbi:MAG: sel1 repeat family protein [Betaproteobacteria bacterium]|nr:sel1 repeat family protein [Betaproteobacteria bacterium]